MDIPFGLKSEKIDSQNIRFFKPNDMVPRFDPGARRLFPAKGKSLPFRG
jgi:hypothetical protein